MEFKGTKGPWRAVNNGPHWNNKSIENWEIQWSEDGECVVDHVYDKYDALLISKAPEMLEMLVEIHEQMEDGRTYITKEDIQKLIKSATEI
jgi:hypothetical protein